MSVEALGNASHLGVAVPIEFLIGGHYHKKKSEFLGLMDGKCDNRVRYLQVAQHLVDLWHTQSIDVLGEQLKIVIGEETLTTKIGVFLCNLKRILQ